MVLVLDAASPRQGLHREPCISRTRHNIRGLTRYGSPPTKIDLLKSGVAPAVGIPKLGGSEVFARYVTVLTWGSHRDKKNESILLFCTVNLVLDVISVRSQQRSLEVVGGFALYLEDEML